MARALLTMPDTEAAFRSGAFGYTHVRELTRAAKDHPEVYREHEDTLVDIAAHLSVRDLRRAIDHWRQNLDGAIG